MLLYAFKVYFIKWYMEIYVERCATKIFPPNSLKSKFNDRSWDNIEVPSNWEMLGYGDKKFRNVSAPFPCKCTFCTK